MQAVRGTMIEQIHPKMRRKNKSMLDSFLKQTFANSFLTFIENNNQSSLSSKPSLKESQQMIQVHYGKINGIIDSIDQHLSRRLQNHEKEIFELVRDEIAAMREQTQEIVLRLNETIKQKNIEDEIWKLSNELDYFKSQTYKLFRENKKMREDMVQLRRQISEDRIQLENSDKVMQKLKRSCMKAKINQQKICKNIKEQMGNISETDLAAKGRSSGVPRERVASEEVEGVPLRYSALIGNVQQSAINIKLTGKNHQISPRKTQQPEYNDPLDQLISQANIQSSISNYNDMPKVNMVRVNSQLMEEHPSPVNHSKHSSTAEAFAQTDPMQDWINISKSNFIDRGENVFSRTSPLQSGPEISLKRKDIDLMKNGFFIKSYNGRGSKNSSGGAGNNPSIKKQNRHMRYMTTALNRSKMQLDSQRQERGRLKTTMK